MSTHYHPFHLVDPSPWPYVGASGAFATTFGSVIYFHYSQTSLLIVGLILLTVTFIFWWRDVIREATFQGHHTAIVRQGLKYGMLLFILSEVCFFVSFFWAFFHSSLAPAVELGAVWPPTGIDVLNPFAVPLLNTAILLSSGATVTWAHHAIISGQRKSALLGLLVTVLLGMIFSALQGMEYYEAPFAIADSVYGSTFFVATGFHGFHVLIGTTFLAVCLVRLINHQFTKHHHFGFEAASWYWHFVDVVWLFLYVCIYWWGA
uniref:Cytochrome c oxidase subunit 3 n=1 Tax=Haliclystus antarcticus TaxID=654955 RepID=A0A173FZP0_HALAN|nr:cytochrome c oxidase subunit III [Haliclystus antarcticus]ANH09489.1 cytochrome c oxidase subunit III [Haliclystus antarcticus]